MYSTEVTYADKAVTSDLPHNESTVRRADSAERLDDFLDHFLGVGEQHHSVVAVEEFVVDAGIADTAHRSLHEEDRPRLFDVENGHSVDRRALVGFGCGVRHVIGADDEGDVSLRELAVDILELE